MLTADAQGVFRADNHGWLFAWSDGYVFQAGPSAAMNWYGTAGGGSQTSAGTRAADGDSMVRLLLRRLTPTTLFLSTDTLSIANKST